MVASGSKGVLPGSGSRPIVILGAGYAGLTAARELNRRLKGKLPVVLVDRLPVHVLRTELYEVGRLARSQTPAAEWTLPLASVLAKTSVEFHQGTVLSIDLGGRSVELEKEVLPFGALAICLGNVPAYYGVPGAREHTFEIYRLEGARRLAQALLEMEQRSANLRGERRPRVVVVGGGATGTELAAEIATEDWQQLAGPSARTPEVVLLTGSQPFLEGLPKRFARRAESVLHRAGVTVVRGYNVTEVRAGSLRTEDGSTYACDLAVWCAGLEAPEVVRKIEVPHGRGGRLIVGPTLEVPGHPGVFGVGDVAEIPAGKPGAVVPATAQAAIEEGRVVAQNMLNRLQGREPLEFTYRERGVFLALGQGEGAGQVRTVPVWGSPAALLKRLLQREYSRAVRAGSSRGIL